MGVWSRFATAGRIIFSANDERTPGPSDDYWYGPIGQKTGTGITITPQVALKASAVFACINKIAKLMSTLSVDVFKEVDDGDEREVDKAHPLHELLRYQPNPNDTAVDFWHFMVWNALLRGTGYSRIETSKRDGTITALTPMATAYVRPELLSSGRYRFKYRDPLRPDLGEQTLLQDEVFRFPGLVPNGVDGLGITDCADEAVAVSLAADQYAARVFQNNLNMGFILEHPGKMNAESKQRFLAALRDRVSGVENAHNPLLLQDGIKATKVAQTAQEAQLIEARRWQLSEICRALDMPGSMVGIEDNGGAKATVEEHSLNFVRFTLQPWAIKIEQAARRDLIVPDEQGKRVHQVVFNFDSLLRGNSTARADYFSKALGSGGSPAWMAVNEVRRIERLPKLAGDAYDKPATGTNPISPDGSVAPVPAKKPAKKEAPPAKEQGTEAATAAERIHERVLARATGLDVVKLDPAAALLSKELKALRKAARKHAGDADAWREYANVFYGGLVSDVMRRLKVEKSAAKQYCQARTQQCEKAESPSVAIEYLEAHGADEIEYFVTDGSE